MLSSCTLVTSSAKPHVVYSTNGALFPGRQPGLLCFQILIAWLTFCAQQAKCRRWYAAEVYYLSRETESTMFRIVTAWLQIKHSSNSSLSEITWATWEWLRVKNQTLGSKWCVHVRPRISPLYQYWCEKFASNISENEIDSRPARFSVCWWLIWFKCRKSSLKREVKFI